MDQVKFYKYIIFGLVGLNVAVLAYFLLSKNHPPNRPPFRNAQAEVIEILGLNDDQASAFRAFANAHGDQMEAIKRQQEQLLIPYFASLSDSATTINQEELLKQYQQLERDKIEFTYQHFQEIKNLLEKEQLPDFKLFTDKILRRLLSGRKKLPPPPKDFE